MRRSTLLGISIALLAATGCSLPPEEPRAEERGSSEYAVTTPPSFPLAISANRRALEDQNGVKFPILGRVAWIIISQPEPDYIAFLDDTVAKGFNAILLQVLDHDGHANTPPRDGNNALPFTRRLDGASWSGSINYASINAEAPDFTAINEPYWTSVDKLLAACESRGLLVFFFPAYVGYAGGEEGWMQEMVANGTSRMQTYGAFLSSRYANQKNLVWMLGGDTSGFNQAQTNVENALITGLKSVPGQSRLYSALWDSNSICTDQPAFASHCSLQGAYSWTGQVVTQARNGYSHTPTMPTFFQEGPYDEEGPDGLNVNPSATQPNRRFQWWGWLSSIGGYFYGNGHVWRFKPGWKDHLDTQGAQDMVRLNAFIRSFAWHDLVPSGLGGMKTLVVSGGGSIGASDYITAAATPDGTLLIAYVPPTGTSGRSFSVDMTAMSVATRARWYNPTTGAYSLVASSLPNSGTRAFTSPGANGTGVNDWVLVLDRVATSAPPTVASAASIANPVTGTSSVVSALGADDGGEAALVYTWSVVGSPAGAVSFAPNGTNGAKSSVATFTAAGTYSLLVTITDGEGQSVTSSVSANVSQTLAAVQVLPSSGIVAPGATLQFTATARDQFGQAMAVQPGFSWSVVGGTISSTGLFTAGTATGVVTVTATTGSTIGTAAVTVTNVATPIARINSGGEAASPFIPDQFFNGGAAYTSPTPVSTVGVSNAAPATVYQSERFGNFNYTFSGLTPGAAYLVRLHFAEVWWTTTGARSFNVVINGAQVLTNFDIVAAVGAFAATVRDFNATADGNGRIVVDYVTVKDNAKASGIELFFNPPPNAPPTIAVPAAASPNPVPGTSTNVSVLGSDDGGEANLTYSWSTTGSPPGPVIFGASGTNSAKNTSATFTKAGAYSLLVTIRDAAGLSTTSSVVVNVNQVSTSVVVTPANASVVAGGTQQFTASAADQFGVTMTPQPSFTWSVGGGGTISSSGLFTAGGAAGGPFTVTAMAGGVSGTAAVTVIPLTSSMLAVNSGGSSTGGYSSDRFFSGGSTYTVNRSIDRRGVADAAPLQVYRSERNGDFSYTVTGLTPGASHTVVLHFAEILYAAAGGRLFNVAINGSPVLSNFDIFLEAGGANRAVVRKFSVVASSDGKVVLKFTPVKNGAKLSGFQIMTP